MNIRFSISFQNMSSASDTYQENNYETKGDFEIIVPQRKVLWYFVI